MYKIGDIVRYNKPYKISEKGEIITKLKVIDDKHNEHIGENVYIISYDKLCDNDLVLEKNIISISK